MKLNFKLSEFNISGEPIPEEVADKILHKHILPMQPVREELNIPMFPSLKSGYRSVWWEKTHGRSGGSQHTFIEDGATDWTCQDFQDHKDQMLESMIKHTDYTRIAIYDGFIHADYKPTKSGKREVYTSNSESKWKFLKYAE